MSEFTIIDKYFKTLSVERHDVALGIGDDCALLNIPPGKQLAVSMDTLVSGIHFPEKTQAIDIGYKALAVNLSDLAAMGAEPAWASLSLTLPEEDHDWLHDFTKGFADLAKQYHVQLIGGDTTHGSLAITVQVFGFLNPGKAMRRNMAKPGDLIYISGTLGDAGLGLKKILAEINTEMELEYCVQRLNHPSVRIDFAKKLADVSACAIDISDGLIADLSHITNQSGCAAVIEIEKLPLSEELKHYYGDKINWQHILTSGDDYELCFTLNPENKNALLSIEKKCNVNLTCIGEVKPGSGITCVKSDGSLLELSTKGYDHFVSNKRFPH